MKVAWGSDNPSHPISQAVESALKELGHSLLNVSNESMSWVDVGLSVGEAVSKQQARRGIVACYTGTGVAIAANKVPHVRAAVINDSDLAEMTRLWNHTNVLAFSMRDTKPESVLEILKIWMKTPNGAEERPQIDKLDAYERMNTRQ